jgi:hypothetical protein
MEAKTSAVSWAAILAGAVVAAATSLIFVLLAAGMGLASVSPWSGSGTSGTLVMTAIALVIIQWLSAGVGGYVTGRLRTKWVGTHTHEVFFRDTAHGFIAWAVATLLVTSTLASGASALLGAGALASGVAVGTLAANAASAGAINNIRPYDLDVLFRTSAGMEAKPGATGAREETGHILARGLVTGDVPAADRTYLAQLIAAQTGASDADAHRRVDDGITQMKAAADAARRSSEMTTILTALAMVVGAFIACVSAALGGRVRDMHP